MKKFILALSLSVSIGAASAQINSRLEPYALEYTLDNNNQLNFIKFKEDRQVNEIEITEFINSFVFKSGNNKAVISKSEKDELGFTHSKYNVFQNGVKVFNKMIIAHSKNGKLLSLNGDLFEVTAPTNQFTITENTALNFALKKVNAKVYKWENKSEEAHMREVLKKTDFTFYPKGVKVIFEKDGKYYNAYQFNIYAEQPLYRANVFVDASNGQVLSEQNLICNADVPATAATKYSGTQTLTCDQNGATYRLRETQRGLGVETYNLNNGTTYASNDFTNTSTSWTVVNTNQAATDAHWGAEKTYDYYFNVFNRNSIDNAGYKLLSYVHYSNNYNNAFWDGIRMTYGDGNGSTFTILTALDVCGHEITHGLVSNTAQLNGGGTGEADALNEAFADIFGTSIERYARPSNWNWKMGSDITPSGNGIRNMANPNALSDPDTYLGTYWDTGGEPHNNAGPAIYWFYLLVTGGSGTNDLSNAFNVSGLGNVDAEKIAYRALTYYFTPGTGYNAARTAAVQAAKDLFGNCSNQVVQTANAWYAVGVGGPYSNATIGPDFAATNTSYCTLPANVNFNNTTSNGLTYTWHFGDGSTSTATNTAHTYTANGTYTVKLVATGCSSNMDSVTKNAYIIVNAPLNPTTSGSSACASNTMMLTASGNGVLNWYTSPTSTNAVNTGTSYITPTLTNTTTYYVVNTITNSPAFGGIPSNTGGGYLTNPAQWLVFDVQQPGTLNSVVVYAQTAGNRTFELRNSSSTVLSSTVINLTVGANTLNLNYNLTPGTNYQLGLSATSTASLYRSNSGVTYPYNVGGVVNITGSSAGSGYYYWAYNWKVTKANCTSAAIAVTASVTSGSAVNISATSTMVCTNSSPVALTGSPAGGSFSGTGVSGSTFNPSVGTGTYNLIYTYSNAGCTGSGNLVMQVSDCTGLNQFANQANNVIIYPNPASDNITLKNATGYSVTFYDATGRVIMGKIILQNEETINTSEFAKGVYFVKLQSTDKSVTSTKLIIQ